MNSYENFCWKEIPISQIGGFRIGNAQDMEAMTGVTVILFDGENRGGIDVSGGGPAARESHLLDPLTNSHSIHGLVLSGGSAFGLAASTGVMRYLRERGIGYHVVNSVVPLVCQSCIFDFSLGSTDVWPDENMGYAACLDGEKNRPVSGIIGAGTGAAVGKVNGIAQGQKSGIGYYALQVGDLKVGAVAVVNAYGDVYDYDSGEKLAGMVNEGRTGFLSAEDALCRKQLQRTSEETAEGTNTTLGVILTNGAFSQPDMSKIASMARAGLGRCVRPVGTMADGDTTYAFSVGHVESEINIVGTLAARVLGKAIGDAVISSAMAEAEFLEKMVRNPKDILVHRG